MPHVAHTIAGFFECSRYRNYIPTFYIVQIWPHVVANCFLKFFARRTEIQYQSRGHKICGGPEQGARD